MSARTRQLATREHGWCLAANRWGGRGVVRAYFRMISRLGDGAFWYALMAGLVLFDGWRGLAASAAARGHRRGGADPVPQAQALDQAPASLRRRRPHPGLDRRRWTNSASPPATRCTRCRSPSSRWRTTRCSGWLLLPFAASVAVSRVVLGLHYPSDVLAATAIGCALASLSLWIAPVAALALQEGLQARCFARKASRLKALRQGSGRVQNVSGFSEGDASPSSRQARRTVSPGWRT